MIFSATAQDAADGEIQLPPGLVLPPGGGIGVAERRGMRVGEGNNEGLDRVATVPGRGRTSPDNSPRRQSQSVEARAPWTHRAGHQELFDAAERVGNLLLLDLLC